jgi:S-adenosyl-L-methionine hydrolase (adenosine-forming)
MARSPTNRGGGAAPIAILTDFGYRDHYVGAMKGVIASIAPGAPLIDITHGVPAQSIAAGAIALAQSWRLFPPRTVFLVVVDPGVGTTRLPVAVQTRAGARFVGPDNGVLSLALEEAGPSRAVELRAPRYRLARVSTTFHGRDIFAPAAATLATGDPIQALGGSVSRPVRTPLPVPHHDGTAVIGEVIYVDRFGTLISNIEPSLVEPGIRIRVGDVDVGAVRRTFADATRGALVAFAGSGGTVEIAVRDGSAARLLGVGVGAEVRA